MANAAPFVAPPQKRVAAGSFDVALCALCFWVVIGVLYDSGIAKSYSYTVSLAIAFSTYALYHFAFFRSLSGATPGLRVLEMQVVRADGGELSVVDALVRSAFRPGLLLLLGASLDAYTRPIVQIDAAIGAALMLELGLMFTLPRRQTLADLAARTLVVNVPPPQPHRAPAAPMYSPKDAEFGLPPKRPK